MIVVNYYKFQLGILNLKSWHLLVGPKVGRGIIGKRHFKLGNDVVRRVWCFLVVVVKFKRKDQS